MKLYNLKRLKVAQYVFLVFAILSLAAQLFASEQSGSSLVIVFALLFYFARECVLAISNQNDRLKAIEGTQGKLETESA